MLTLLLPRNQYIGVLSFYLYMRISVVTLPNDSKGKK